MSDVQSALYGVCHHCGAAPGERCVTDSGVEYRDYLHVRRGLSEPPPRPVLTDPLVTVDDVAKLDALGEFDEWWRTLGRLLHQRAKVRSSS